MVFDVEAGQLSTLLDQKTEHCVSQVNRLANVSMLSAIVAMICARDLPLLALLLGLVTIACWLCGLTYCYEVHAYLHARVQIIKLRRRKRL